MANAPASRASGISARDPGLITLRPADANEVVEAWHVILRDSATNRSTLVLTRQAVPTLNRTKYAAADGPATSGAYILADADDGRPPHFDLGDWQ